MDFEAKENGEPIKAVNRCKPLTVDVEGAPNIELLKKSSLMEEYNWVVFSLLKFSAALGKLPYIIIIYL